MKTVFSAVGLVALSLAGPALAQSTDWSQPGDYYRPSQTIVQKPTLQQKRRFEEGDYYKSVPTVVQPANPGEQRQFEDGDYYAPVNGK
jgi:hypothetical protein